MAMRISIRSRIFAVIALLGSLLLSGCGSSAVENESMHGPVNTGAPEQIRQKDFMKMFGKAYGRYVLFSIPIFLLYLRYGDLAYTFDNSTKMSSKKLLEAGFKHKYPQLIEALKNVIKNRS